MGISINSPQFNAIASDLQGNILKSHGRDSAAHLFIRFNDPHTAKEFIKKEVIKRITSAAEQKQDSIDFKQDRSNGFRDFISFAISQLGYDFLGVPLGNHPPDPSFKAKQRNQQDLLSDPDVSDWEEPYQTEYHAMMIIANTAEGKVQQRVSFILNKLRPITSRIHVEQGRGIRNKQGAHIEHFGFVDGISQPLLINDDLTSGKISRNNWDPEADLNLALVRDPGGEDDNSFGSYLVFRKLQQDVPGWNNAVVTQAAHLGIDPNYFGAQLVGRFKSGNPLIPVTPPQPGPLKSQNDFNYDADDTVGSKCPFHAHIRKTNPRGTGGFESPDDEKKHLFVRRGITYGELGGSDVGLLFMCYNSDIENQFEFMQKNWANNTGFPGNKPNGPHGKDPVVGQGSNRPDQNYATTWGDDSSMTSHPNFGQFVTMKGGEYFFTPSISFLKSL